MKFFAIRYHYHINIHLEKDFIQQDIHTLFIKCKLFTHSTGKEAEDHTQTNET